MTATAAAPTNGTARDRLLEAVRARAGELLPLLCGDEGEQKGGQVWFRSPLRSTPERTPSLAWHPGKQVWHDHGTGEGGDIFNLVARVHGLDVKTEFRRVLDTAAEKLGIEGGDVAPPAAPHSSPSPSPVPEGLDPLEEWCHRRGFDVEAVRRIGVESVEGITVNGTLVERGVSFVMRDGEGRTIGRKVRFADGRIFGRTKAKAEVPAKNRTGLICEWPLPDGNPLLIVEGEPDLCAVLSAGHRAAVATASAAVPAPSLDALAALCRDRVVVLLPQDGEAARKWTGKIAERLQRDGIDALVVPADPSGTRDVDDRLRDAPDRAAALAALLASAAPFVPEEGAEEMETEQPCAHPWRRIRGAELWEPLPLREYLVDGLIPERSLTMFAGEAGSMKTGLVASMAWAVAEGAEWMGHKTKRGPVLWLNQDMDGTETHARLQAFGRGAGASPDAPMTIIPWPIPSLQLTDSDSVALLIEAIREDAARLVVLDALVAIRGDADENDASQMGGVMTTLRTVSETTGAAIVLIHHSGRNAESAYRGSSAIRDLLDLSMKVERIDKDVTSARPDKVRRASPEKIVARFNYEWIAGTKELKAAWFVQESVPDIGAEIAESLCAAIEAQGPLNTRQLIAAAKADGHPERRTRDTIKRLADAGKLIGRPGDKGAIVYRSGGF